MRRWRRTRRVMALLGIASLIYICVIASLHAMSVQRERAQISTAHSTPTPVSTWTIPPCERGQLPFNSQECYPNP